MPRGDRGEPSIYFCGNSLGLMPKTAKALVVQELDDWATLAVQGHFGARTPWYSYHEEFRQPFAELTGALPHEVVAMNGLTVNLHLMMASFYRPSPDRHKILVEDNAFPSDRYAVQSQIAWHGYDVADALVVAAPRECENTLRTEDVEATLEERGREIALVLLGGVNYYNAADCRCRSASGMCRRVRSRPRRWERSSGAPRVGCGFWHLVLVQVLEWRTRIDWWGLRPRATWSRFRMSPQFIPREGVDGWQLSNPPILSMAALRPSLAIFSEVGMLALREKSLRLTGFLEYLVDGTQSTTLEVITPRPNGEDANFLSASREMLPRCSTPSQHAELWRTFESPTSFVWHPYLSTTPSMRSGASG